MELEFYQELLLTAVISILFAFLLAKIAREGDDGGERLEDALTSSYLPISGENLLRETDEGLQATADVAGTCERVCGFESEIAGVEVRGGASEVVEEIVEEKRDVIDTQSAEDLKEEVMDEDEKKAVSSSSDEKIGREQGTDDEIDRGDQLMTENNGGSLLHGEDEWEGIERSELEKRFGVAADYSASISGSVALSRLSNDVQMELYGLHKIATEGPCYEPQPLPLMVSARARWHAWQKLGRMSPEAAMEQYINLLSKNIPG